MELNIRLGLKNKKINIDNSILSIQSNDEKVIDNLIEDYNILVIDNRDDYFISKTVIDEISSYAKYPELNIVTDIMYFLGLEKDFFDRKLASLSRTERIYLNILRNIAKIENIILFKDIFLGLDLSNKKKIIALINYLKIHNYLVIVCSNDVNDLYNISDYSVICNKSNIKYGITDEIYTDVKTLIKYKLNVPTLSYITYKAKEEKNVKLFYTKDVRDIIKDIYKHV